MADQEFHKLYSDEFDDAWCKAAGAYMGAKMATGSHLTALEAAAQEAFNAGVQVGKDNPDG